MYRISSLLLVLAVFFSCKNDAADPAGSTPEAIPAATHENKTSGEKTSAEVLAELKANAFDEDDKFGRINHSLGQVQKQFTLSNKLRPEDGIRTIFIYENYT